MMENHLLPNIYRVKSIKQETHDIFTLTLKNKNGEGDGGFLPGQFNMLYHFGFGEVAISLSGNPSDRDVLVHTIRAVGSVTDSLQKIRPGEEIGVRGPYGRPWPLSIEGTPCNVMVIAGGVGLAPLRSALYHISEQRDRYHKVSLLYGARTPDDILYQKEMRGWKKSGFDIDVTVDHADAGWRGKVGVVTTLIQKHLSNPKNTLVLICGPEIMIKFSIHELLRATIDENNVYMSMERNMNCALGFCGHCQYGPYFLCKDGPVYSYPQLKSWLTIKEL